MQFLWVRTHNRLLMQPRALEFSQKPAVNLAQGVPNFQLPSLEISFFHQPEGHAGRVQSSALPGARDFGPHLTSASPSLQSGE